MTDSKILESIPVFNHVVDSQTDLNIDLTQNYYFESRIWNLALQTAYNRCKLTNMTVIMLWP